MLTWTCGWSVRYTWHLHVHLAAQKLSALHWRNTDSFSGRYKIQGMLWPNGTYCPTSITRSSSSSTTRTLDLDRRLEASRMRDRETTRKHLRKSLFGLHIGIDLHQSRDHQETLATAFFVQSCVLMIGQCVFQNTSAFQTIKIFIVIADKNILVTQFPSDYRDCRTFTCDAT